MKARGVVAALGLAGAACGGGGSDTVAPPPPGGPGPAAQLVMVAGDEQSAVAGALLPVKPAVTVRDARGQAVAGATVTFAVVAGGGSLSDAVAISTAQGIATAGGWTLGASGDQALEARLGTLAPVRFSATVISGTVNAIIPPSGGTMEITAQGHPYRGFRLSIPPGSYSDPGTWRIELAANVSVPALPAGFIVAGPALRIETDRGRSGRLMSIRVPAPRVPGAVRVMLFYDPTRPTAMETVPIVAEDSASVTGIVGHLNAAMLLARGRATGSARLAGSGSIIGYLQPASVSLNALGITGTMLQSFLSETWPASDQGSYAFPAGHGPAVALLNLFGALQNQSFNGVVQVTRPFGTLADTASFASLQIIADRHRHSASVRQAIDDFSAALVSTPVATRDSLAAVNLWSGLAVSQLPQLMLFEERFGGSPGRRAFATMFGNANGATWFASSSSPTMQSSLALGPAGFDARLDKEVEDAIPFNAQGILPLGGSFIFPVEAFQDVAPTMMAALTAQGAARDQANRALAAAAAFPTVSLEVQAAATGDWAPADATVVIRDSTALLRAQCTDCSQALPQGGSATRQTVAVDNKSPGGASALVFPLGPGSTKPVLDALGVGDLRGAIMTLMNVVPAPLGTALRMAVPIRVPLATALFRQSPDSQSVRLDSLVPLRTSVALPPPQGYAIDWDFGDGTPIVRGVDTEGVSHRYTRTGTFVVRASLHAGANSALPNLLLATSVGKAVVSDPGFPVWRITSATVTADAIPPNASAWATEVNNSMVETQFWSEIKNGQRDGALIFATGPAGAVTVRGLWMYPTTPIDFAALPPKPTNFLLTMANIGALNQQSANSALNGSYQETGTPPDFGSITGRSWISTVPSPTRPASYREATVTFAGTTASGQVTSTYRALGGFDSSILVTSWQTKITFTAERVR